MSYIRNTFIVTWDDNLEDNNEFDNCPLNSSDSILVIDGTKELGIGIMKNITISKSTKTIKDDLHPEISTYKKVCIRRNQNVKSRGHILDVYDPKFWADLNGLIFSEKKIQGTSRLQKYPWFDSNHQHDDGATT